MKKTLDQLVDFLKKELQKKETGSKKTRRKIIRKKKTNPISEDVILKDIRLSIQKTGCKSVTVGGFYRAFGHKRRGPKNTIEINEFLNKNNLHSYPALTSSLSWSSRIEIHQFPVKSKGDLYKIEKKLQEDIFAKGYLNKLNLDQIIPEYSPERTKDRLDFYAKDGEKNVVIEVKNKDGGKRAVEQVLRYAGMLKQQHPDSEIRKILITGVQDQHTAKAIYGMTEEERNGFEWYLYIHHQETGNIDFDKIDYNKLF